MIITTHFGDSVVYILQLYPRQARLYRGEKIDRVYYFQFLIRFCFAIASSMLHLITYYVIFVCVLFSTSSGLELVLSSIVVMHRPAQGPADLNNFS